LGSKFPDRREHSNDRAAPAFGIDALGKLGQLASGLGSTNLSQGSKTSNVFRSEDFLLSRIKCAPGLPPGRVKQAKRGASTGRA